MKVIGKMVDGGVMMEMAMEEWKDLAHVLDVKPCNQRDLGPSVMMYAYPRIIFRVTPEKAKGMFDGLFAPTRCWPVKAKATR